MPAKKTAKKNEQKIITDGQFNLLKDVQEALFNIRVLLEDLKGEDSLSSIMFDIGTAYKIADTCENTLTDVIHDLSDDAEFEF